MKPISPDEFKIATIQDKKIEEINSQIKANGTSGVVQQLFGLPAHLKRRN